MYHIIVNPQGGKGKSLKALTTVEEIFKNNNAQYVVHKPSTQDTPPKSQENCQKHRTQILWLWAATALFTRCFAESTTSTTLRSVS